MKGCEKATIGEYRQMLAIVISELFGKYADKDKAMALLKYFVAKQAIEDVLRAGGNMRAARNWLIPMSEFLGRPLSREDFRDAVEITQRMSIVDRPQDYAAQGMRIADTLPNGGTPQSPKHPVASVRWPRRT